MSSDFVPIPPTNFQYFPSTQLLTLVTSTWHLQPTGICCWKIGELGSVLFYSGGHWYTQEKTATWQVTGLDNGTKNMCFVGSDREDAVEKGKCPFLPIATWLPCKSHVEEDCKRKFQSLGISLQHCTAFLYDIFGPDVKLEKGLIDSDGCEDFNAKLESFQNVWNLREKKIKGCDALWFKRSRISQVLCDTSSTRHEEKDDFTHQKASGPWGIIFLQQCRRVQAPVGKGTKRADVRRKKTRLDRSGWVTEIYFQRGRKKLRMSYCGQRSLQDKSYSSKLHVPFHAYISKSHAQKEKINKKVHELSS